MNATLPYRANANLLEEKYSAWKTDAHSVEPDWASFFEGFELGMTQRAAASTASSSDPTGQMLSEDALSFRTKVTNAILDFRRIGHTAAWLNPLSKAAPEQPLLTPAGLGFTEADLDAMERGEHFGGVSQKGVTAPSLTITPKMREAIMKGQTAYARGGSVPFGPEAAQRAVQIAKQQAGRR
jgi:2-oxoglutarate dehydrogenase complex dehydrogenase (E1) component-like enzyme